jgi:hypothetical protein
MYKQAQRQKPNYYKKSEKYISSTHKQINMTVNWHTLLQNLILVGYAHKQEALLVSGKAQRVHSLTPNQVSG